MTKDEVIALLEENRDERGMKNWDKLGDPGKGKMASFGIGLTKLRKLAKQVGKSHELAAELWGVPIYDVKVVGLLIDEPKKMSKEQVEAQVGVSGIGLLAHVFSSCDAALAKTAFAGELAAEWIDSKDPVRRRCGYGLVYELSKSTKKGAPEDGFYEACVERIERDIHGEENWVKDGMLAALFGIGKRSVALNAAAVKAARAIGPVEIDYGDTGCEPIDVVKHLTSEGLRKRLKR